MQIEMIPLFEIDETDLVKDHRHGSFFEAIWMHEEKVIARIFLGAREYSLRHEEGGTFFKLDEQHLTDVGHTLLSTMCEIYDENVAICTFGDMNEDESKDDN